MSYRTANADGTVIGNSGTEGAAAELDPLGGNVGTFTPYFQFNTTPIRPEIPTMQNMNEFTPRGADGQQVRMVMDGIEVPFWMGITALNNGSAIPAGLAQYQNLPGFSFQSIGSGQFSVSIPKQVGWNVNPNGSVSREYSKYSFDTFTWNLPQQAQTATFNGKKYKVVPDTYKDALKNSLGTRLQKEKCRNAINSLLKQLGSNFEDLQAIYKAVDDDNGFLQTVNNIDGNPAAFADREKGKRIIVANANNRNYDDDNYRNNLLGNETQTLIHELLHQAKKGGTFSHTQIAIAMLLTSKILGDTPITVTKNNQDKSDPKKNKDDENSSYMNNWINNYCPAAQISEVLPHETGH